MGMADWYRQEQAKKTPPKAGQPHPSRGDYEYDRIGSMAQGDAFLDERDEAFTIQSAALSQSENHLTVFARPRRGQVGSDVISRLQFGVPGITTEDNEERLFRFHVDDVIPRRR